MKSKYISFAEVLKRKQPKTLLDMFLEWEENPRNKFVLHLDQSSTSRSNNNFSTMLSSKNQQQGIMFDSWIEGLGSQDNHLKNESEYHREFKETRKQNGPKKIILTSRGKQNKNIIQERKTNIIQQKSPNNVRSPAPQIEMITSKEVKTERTLPDLKKSPASYKNKETPTQLENSNYHSKSQKPINSFNLQKESVANNLPSVKNTKKNQQKQMFYNNIKEKDENKGELQKIIDATDNIHIQIGQMAHHFVLEQKKKKQLEEEELLLSLEEQKRISLKSQNKQRVSFINQIPKTDNHQDIQKKLREQVKKQVGNFLKTNMSKGTLPSFGLKFNQNAAPKTANEYSHNIHNHDTSESPIIGNVGFSFSSCVQAQQENKQNQIPQLQISEVPVIPQIPQIQSERNHSESNEQIYDFYQKWRQKENIYFEKHCENAPHIQSVVYNNEANNPYLNTLSKNQNLQIQQGDVVHNTFGKHQRQLQLKSPEVNTNNKQLKSEQKPQILVTIPSNYKELTNLPTQNQEIQLAGNDYQSNLKTQILCLSASPQALEMPDKQPQQYPNLKQFEPNKEIELEVQENHQPQTIDKCELGQKFQDQRQNNLIKSIQIQKNASPKEESTHLVKKQEKTEMLIQKANEKVQKNSPNQHSNSHKLNKVYSSPKENIVVPVKTAVISQFSATQDTKKPEEYKITYVTMKYNGGKFDFGYNSKQNLDQKKTTVDEKVSLPQKQPKKVQIFSQPKLEDRAVINRIESYAYMKNNPAPTPVLKNSIKQEEKDEFQFDF